MFLACVSVVHLFKTVKKNRNDSLVKLAHVNFGQNKEHIHICHRIAAPGYNMKMNNISFKSVSVTNQCCSLMLLICVGMKIVLAI